MSTIPDNAADLARRCFRAFQTANRAEIEALLHEDFTFTSPYDDHIDRAAYFERCWPFAGSFSFHEIKGIVPDGNDGVLVLYEGRSREGGSFRNVEQLRFKDGRIVSAEVFFGREPS